MDLNIPFFDDIENSNYSSPDSQNKAQEYKDFFKGLPEILQEVIRRVVKTDAIIMGETLENGDKGFITIHFCHIFSQSLVSLCDNFDIDWDEKENHFKKYNHLISDYYGSKNSDSVLVEGIRGWNRFYIFGNDTKDLLQSIHMRISGTLTPGGLEGTVEDKQKQAREILIKYGIKPFN